MRKKDEKLQDALLLTARKILQTEGPEHLNIRVIARQAGVSVGTVYNYFSNKEDILLTLTEEYWKTTLSEMKKEIHEGPFKDQIKEIYFFLKEQISSSAGFLMNSLHHVEADGRIRMETMQKVLNFYLITLIIQDHTIKETVWSPDFTLEQYACFLTGNMIMLLTNGSGDIHFLVTVITRTLYAF